MDRPLTYSTISLKGQNCLTRIKIVFNGMQPVHEVIHQDTELNIMACHKL